MILIVHKISYIWHHLLFCILYIVVMYLSNHYIL
uniref:Uncharacterized protein n=1 Tax=Siphoviridae sp. ct1IF5 TaxID=2827765 RepID=A0A8S5TFA1_9CAUD|nr:MAG TPA: hypothetical protein [Siphoviridae sp. ct1IF5]